MLESRFSFALLACCLLALPCTGTTELPDPLLSDASIAYGGPDIPSLLIAPDGSGPSFAAARDEEGQTVDATITLHLRDFQGNPFILFPREDMWLETHDGNQVACGGNMIADQDTDADGVTYWLNPQPAGGSSEGPVFVYVIGMMLPNGLPLKFRSPDINGDLQVSLHDVAIFAGDYFGGYHPRSDLSGDGALNLSDLAMLATHFQAICP
jgi:hypothetical protein